MKEKNLSVYFLGRIQSPSYPFGFDCTAVKKKTERTLNRCTPFFYCLILKILAALIDNDPTEIVYFFR
jgi:hypothetical protein